MNPLHSPHITKSDSVVFFRSLRYTGCFSFICSLLNLNIPFFLSLLNADRLSFFDKVVISNKCSGCFKSICLFSLVWNIPQNVQGRLGLAHFSTSTWSSAADPAVLSCGCKCPSSTADSVVSF